MAQKYLGIDLGAHTVKAVLISGGLRGVQVLGRFEESVRPGEGEDSLGASLAAAGRMVEAHGLGQRPTAVILPGGSGSFRVLAFPFSDAKRVAQAVAFEVDGQFPVPLEELAYDHITVPTGNKAGQALVVAARSAVVERVASTLSDLGVDVRVVTVGSVAIAQAAAGLVPVAGEMLENERPVSLVVDIGHRTTELVAIGENGPLAARTLRKGGQALTRELRRAYAFADEAQAELSKHSDAFLAEPGAGLDRRQLEAAELVKRAMQPLAREIEHTRQWLRIEYSLIITEIRLLGGGAALRGMDAWLAVETGLPIVPAGPGKGIRVEGSPSWGAHLGALGAALAVARRPLVQLHDADGPGGDSRWLYERMSTAAMLGIAVLAFAAVDTMVKVRAVEKERDAYVSELEDESFTVFGEEVTDADEVRARLTAVESEDLSTKIPKRGALEILQLLSKVGVPIGGRTAPVPLGADGAPVIAELSASGYSSVTGGVGPTVDPVMAYPTDAADAADADPAGEGEAGEGPLGDDDLVFSFVDIRPIKVEVRLTASRATAQDRLAARLATVGCVGQVSKGKIKDRNERKEFEMSFDHQCYFAADFGEK